MWLINKYNNYVIILYTACGNTRTIKNIIITTDAVGRYKQIDRMLSNRLQHFADFHVDDENIIISCYTVAQVVGR